MIFLDNFEKKNKRAQATIFIIIAILIVVGVVIFLIARGSFKIDSIPSSVKPAYSSFLSCLEEDGITGAGILQTQAGYIYLPDFEPGSKYVPFSSQLEFMGNAIPYWYYVSGNNIQKQQVPSKSDMENQLEKYIEEKIRKCSLNSYTEQGFEVGFGEPKADVKIKDFELDINLNMDLRIVKGEDSAIIKDHNVKAKTSLGKLYDSAKKVYDYEQRELFLEKYAIDTLNTYAPVTGVEISCSPKIWNAEEVFSTLQDAIESNTLALKTSPAVRKQNKYFEVKLPVDEEVRFLNFKTWEYSYEVEPNEGSLLIANPVGNQQGLGILGFCYVPYHFVYNVNYPVLIQVNDKDNEETFQFPMAVVIRSNNPRESLIGTEQDSELNELCTYKNNLINVRVQDDSSNPIDAEVYFECLGTKCNIGTAENGILNGEFPQCANGYVVARAEGFEDARYLYPSTTSGSVNLIMNRKYDVDVSLYLDSVLYNKEAVITFTSDSGATSMAYPQQRTVSLTEGQYEISVQVYESGEIKFESSVKEQCVDVPASGISGIFGLTRKKCFDVQIPEQVITNVLTGGGTQQYYVLDSELARGSLRIDAQRLLSPKTLEELQTNYILIEGKTLGINFN